MMTEQEEFFSPNHKRLLDIATWAKYLAWVVLIVYILSAIGTYIQEKNISAYYQQFIGVQHPSYLISIYLECLGVFLRGVVYFLVLKGISLGLNMIVETDINYRERDRGAE
jgi:hypothetical protein